MSAWIEDVFFAGGDVVGRKIQIYQLDARLLARPSLFSAEVAAGDRAPSTVPNRNDLLKATVIVRQHLRCPGLLTKPVKPWPDLRSGARAPATTRVAMNGQDVHCLTGAT